MTATGSMLQVIKNDSHSHKPVTATAAGYKEEKS